MLKHKTKIIASKIVYCDSFVRKGTGLIFRTKNSVNDKAWIFRFKSPKRVSITMFFVFFPIDVVFLDKHDKIIELKKNFRPFSNYTSRNEIHAFIELKSGTIDRYSLKKGLILRY